MKNVIEMFGVTKHFGAKRALANVSFEVRPGQVFALLGDNGAGKSTVIRTLLGLVKADRGAARVLGLDSWSQGRQIREQIGYVPDQPALYEWMSVDQIGWFASGFSTARFLDDYRSRVAEFGLDPRAKIKGLSKGMKAKVGLALALAGDPEVLILDEPTSGLDAIVRREFLESMVDVAASGRAVLLSSHQIAEVERVADTIAILHGGEIILWDALDTLRAEVHVVQTIGAVANIDGWPGEILSCERRERQTRLIIRAPAEIDLSATDEARAADHVDVRPASLEEIFIAYVKRSQTPKEREALSK